MITYQKKLIKPKTMRSLSFAIITFILSLPFITFAQGDRIESLRGKWLFQLGDNKDYAKPDYDDSDWEVVYVPSTWQKEGFYNYSGYAWYRTTFELDNDINTNSLFLKLGRIDDSDEVYLNGKYIGGMGGFPPDYFTAFNVQRSYYIPEEYLSQNGRNTIAVRVFDEGGVGGITNGFIGIYQENAGTENSISLVGNWKFQLFDNMDYAERNFNDSDWDNIVVPSTWEHQGFSEYDGFAWYRKKFTISTNKELKDMILLLGKIDDMDQVYINGYKVGETGDIERKWAKDGEWDKYRIYYIPNGLLEPGKQNTIAVRVYDQEQRGGIYQGPVAIIPRTEYKAFWKQYYKYHENGFANWIMSWQY